MKENKPWEHSGRWLAAVIGALSLVLWASGGEAKSSKRAQASTAAPASVAKSPVCDTQIHPKITKVTPDPVKSGQKITIKGQNFGSKACFQKVSFGRQDTRQFQYVNDSTLIATVPNVKPGLTPVHILTAGGASEYILLVEKGPVKKSRTVTKAKPKKKRKRSSKR